MDLSGIESIIPDLARLFNIEPSTALLIVGVLVAVCNLVGRLIPDTATGALGVVRKACKLIGLYASNRVAPNASVNDAARLITGTPRK